MRLTTRLLSAAALTGALALGAAPAASAASALDGYSKTIHKSGFGEVIAKCPYPYRATGGGVAVDHKDEIDTLHSRPTQDGRGWEGLALGEVEPPEKDGEKTGKKADKKADGSTKGEMDRPDEKLSGLPLTVYVVCSL